jgi:hypothetical protein
MRRGWYLSSGVPTNMLYGIVISMRTACSAHLILRDFYHFNNWWLVQIMKLPIL